VLRSRISICACQDSNPTQTLGCTSLGESRNKLSKVYKIDYSCYGSCGTAMEVDDEGRWIRVHIAPSSLIRSR